MPIIRLDWNNGYCCCVLVTTFSRRFFTLFTDTHIFVSIKLAEKISADIGIALKFSPEFYDEAVKAGWKNSSAY